MPRSVRKLAPVAALVMLALLPRIAWAAGPEFSIDVVADGNGFLLFGGASRSIDSGASGAVQFAAIPLTPPPGTTVAFSVSTTSGAGLSFNPQAVSINGQPTPVLLSINAASASPGQYTVTITGTPSDGSPSVSVTRFLLITTPAADFKSMSASTSMSVTITGTQTLIVGLPMPSADVTAGAFTCCPGSYLIILHNTSPAGGATIAVTSGGTSITLAPGDVASAVFSRANNVTGTAYDAATGTLQIGYPGS